MSYIFWVILSMIKYQFCLITATIAQSWLFLLLTFIGGLIGIVIFTQIGYDIKLCAPTEPPQVRNKARIGGRAIETSLRCLFLFK